EARVARRLPLRHAREVASQEASQGERVQRALMVEEEDRGTVRPEVLLAGDLELDPGQGERQVAAGAGRQVAGDAAAAIEQADPHADPGGGAEAGERGPGANDGPQPQTGSGSEPRDRPAPLVRYLRQAALGVERPRATDGLQEGQV